MRFWFWNIIFLLWDILAAIILLSLGERLFAILVLCGPVGKLLNILAVAANSWKMPVLVKNRFIKEGLERSDMHTKLTKKTKLKCLCDIYYGTISVFSIGDVLLKIGVWSFYLAMLKIAVKIIISAV